MGIRARAERIRTNNPALSTKIRPGRDEQGRLKAGTKISTRMGADFYTGALHMAAFRPLHRAQSRIIRSGHRSENKTAEINYK